MRIAICPGHTAKKRGAVNKKYILNEHDEACKVALYLLESLCLRGHQVRYFSGGLTKKVKQINADTFDVALDIHFNADADHLDPDDLDDSRGSGVMVMHYPSAQRYEDIEPTSEALLEADEMSSGIADVLDSVDLGVRAGWYWGDLDKWGRPVQKDYFLRKTTCRAFIPELGYIDNNAFAEKWLISDRHKKLAFAIETGLLQAMQL